MIQELFIAIDSKDAKGFGAFLTDDCVFRFGNQDAVTGKQNVVPYVSHFFDSIRSVSHTLADVWSAGDAVVCHGHVTYVRQNGMPLNVPFCNVMKLAGAKISEYLIFVDASALYQM